LAKKLFGAAKEVRDISVAMETAALVITEQPFLPLVISVEGGAKIDAVRGSIRRRFPMLTIARRRCAIDPRAVGAPLAAHGGPGRRASTSIIGTLHRSKDHGQEIVDETYRRQTHLDQKTARQGVAGACEIGRIFHAGPRRFWRYGENGPRNDTRTGV
jgi:hypothetical protein